MIKRLLAWSVALLLITSAEARERSPLEQASKIAPGSKVVVTLKDKHALRGRLGEVTQDRFTLEPLAPGAWANRELLFQDVQKITQRKEPSAVKKVGQGVLLVILLPVFLLYCGVFNHDCV